MITDYDDLFERYSIMSEQHDVGEAKAIAYIAEHTTRELFRKLMEEIKWENRK